MLGMGLSPPTILAVRIYVEAYVWIDGSTSNDFVLTHVAVTVEMFNGFVWLVSLDTVSNSSTDYPFIIYTGRSGSHSQLPILPLA